jgi:hypothetical protein
MRHTTRLLLFLALTATAVFSLPAPSQANRALATPTQAAVSGAGGATQNHWWGGAAAIACGLGIRGWPAFGWNLGYNALVTVACITVLLDSF